MAEEILRNVEPRAATRHASLSLRAVGADELELETSDAGVDVTADHAGHFGIVGLRELAQMIGADLTIDRVRDRGTSVRIHLRTTPLAME